ncbi:putative parB-like nuclease [Escherichia coli P0304816.11]|nr:putative parB-like nuclease [Escherichia coli P0304816.11]
MFGSGAYSKPAQISLECKHYSLTSDAPSGKEGAAFMALMAEKARLAALLPEGWSRDMTTFLSLSQEVLLSLLSFCTACSLTVSRPVSAVTRHAVRLTRWKRLSDSTCVTGGSQPEGIILER